MPGAQPVPEVVTARPEGELVMVALPAGRDGANDTPLKLESDGAVSSSENDKDAPGGVVLLRESVIPYR